MKLPTKSTALNLIPGLIKETLASSFIQRPKFLEMEKCVLSYPKIQERLKNRPEDLNKIQKNLKEIRSELSPSVLYSFEKFLDATLSQLYDGFDFNDEKIQNETHKMDDLLAHHHVVLVPNHQSHADYVAINYMFHKKYKKPLIVAGGNNLDIFPIGTLFRKCGCFFIRRSFSSDIVYKLTLEAYLYYLLIENHPIEFFFEGGRSRTGKLLEPRYGLYQMIIEAHEAIPGHLKKPLSFIPVSIVHEYVPEQKSLARELDGGKKKKESAAQVLGLVKLFSYQFGNIHMSMGSPITMSEGMSKISELHPADLKSFVQKLAFQCFTEVGRNMPMTPTSLLAMVLLDEPSGALKWDEILVKCRSIVEFAKTFHIPLTDSLTGSEFEQSLGRSMDILIGNHKIEVIGSEQSGHVFYAILEDSRKEILYFKNTILHHFLVPSLVSSAWIRLFHGEILNVSDLKKFFFQQRKRLIFEFYLPSIKEIFILALKIVSHSVGRDIHSLDECLNLNHKELYLILTKVAPFSRAYHSLTEAYYISAKTLLDLHAKQKDGFKIETYLKRSKEIFDNEKKLQRMIKYPESFSEPLARSALQYFIYIKAIENKKGFMEISELNKLQEIYEQFSNDLSAKLSIQINQ